MSATHDKEAAEDSRQMTLVLNSFQRDGISTKTDAEKISYLSANLLLSYQLLRGLVDDDWVKGWLESALADLKVNPAMVLIRKPS